MRRIAALFAALLLPACGGPPFTTADRAATPPSDEAGNPGSQVPIPDPVGDAASAGNRDDAGLPDPPAPLPTSPTPPGSPEAGSPPVDPPDAPPPAREATAPSCGPGNCAGCCDSTGTCQRGGSDTACGASGNACGDCAPLTCLSGACVGATCMPALCPACSNGLSCCAAGGCGCVGGAGLCVAN